MIDQIERYSRQADLVPVDKLEAMLVTVVGVGAIGRRIALQLAAMGVPKIQLIDFDVVEDGNLAAQGFLENDLGKTKVEAVTAMCKAINSEIEIIEVPERFKRNVFVGNVLFCCVDNIETRGFIWESVKDKVELFVDGRMSAEALRILVVSDDGGKRHYPDTLFAAEQAFQGTCTAKTTIYSSNVIAGIMVAQLAKHLRGLPLDFDVQFNLMTHELDAKDIRELDKIESEKDIPF